MNEFVIRFIFLIEHIPEKNKLFHIIPATSERWSLSFDVTPHVIPANDQDLNIIQLTTKNETDQTTLNVPAIFQRKG